MLLDLWDVLHRHQFGLQFTDQSAELRQQSPLGAEVSLASVRIGREGLAGSASSQQSHAAFREQIVQCISLELGDVAQAKRGLVVLFVRILTRRVDVNSGENLDVGLAQSIGQSARSAEE